MANPLDMVTEDQSVDPDADGVRRVVIRTPGAPAPDLGVPAGLGDNKLMQAVAPEQPNELMQGIAALKEYLLNGQFSPGTKVGNRLFGTGGEERQQLWPERMIRSGLTLPGDVASGAEPMLPPGLRREDITDMPAPGSLTVTAQPGDTVRERAQDMAGLAGGSALAERPGAGTLGSGALRPGARTMPVEPAPVFYSALEHAATNAAQDVMSPQQWLGYLKNQPGVKQEELQWTGIGDWLGQQKGKVSKNDVQQYLDGHKVEIKDVTKHGDEEGAEGYHHHDMDAAEEHASEVMQADFDKLPAKERAKYEDVDDWITNSDHADELLDRHSDIANDWLDTNAEPIAGPHDTKYSSYQLPGGDNYREHLLTLPDSTRSAVRAINEEMINKYGGLAEAFKKWTPEEAARYDQVHGTHSANPAMERPEYRSSHWDEPNVLAHVRTNDRDVGGKKSLHIEEIQSDWHQQGRKQGYKYQALTPEMRAAAEKAFGPDVDLTTMSQANIRLAAGLGMIDDTEAGLLSSYKDNNGVPDAPFKTTWPELALKRMIRHAAENGYDRISWTPGEAQAARYDLSKQVDKLAYDPKTGHLQGFKDGGMALDNRVPKDKLADFVGKEAAEKLLNKPTKVLGNGYHTLENADLKVGGEGMREFYDKMLPKMAEKIGKAHGVKVKTTEAVSGGKEQLSKNILSHPNLKTILDEMQYNHATRAGWSEEKAHKFLKDLAQKDPEKFVKEYEKITGNYDDPHMKISGMDDVVPALHYFDLPQSLKDHAIGKGFPLYMSSIPFPLTPVDHDPFKGMQNLSKKEALAGVGLDKDAPEHKERLNSAVSDVLAGIEREHGGGWLDKLTPEQVAEFQKRVKQHMKEHK